MDRILPFAAAAVLAAAPALADPAGESCRAAGHRPGTAAFSACLMGAETPVTQSETVPDEAPAAPTPGETRREAGAALPPPGQKPPPLVGNITINGERISSAPAPTPPPPAAPPAAAGPPVAGFPPIVQPTMPVMAVPNWAWSGFGQQ